MYLPKPIYESLPVAYIGTGLFTSSAAAATVGGSYTEFALFIFGFLLLVLGGIITTMRISYRYHNGPHLMERRRF